MNTPCINTRVRLSRRHSLRDMKARFAVIDSARITSINHHRFPAALVSRIVAGLEEVEIRVTLLSLTNRFTRIAKLDPAAPVNNIKVVRTTLVNAFGDVPIGLKPWGIRWIEIECKQHVFRPEQ